MTIFIGDVHGEFEELAHRLAVRKIEDSVLIQVIMSSQQSAYLHKDFSETDWNALMDLYQNCLNLSIYDEGEKYGGELFSRVELSIFDYIMGSRNVIRQKDEKVYVNISKKHYPKQYEQLENMQNN